MLVYFIKRLLMLIPVLFCVSILVFLIMRVFSPDPALIVLGQHATTEKINMWRESMGLNDPIVTQYIDYMKAVFQGDFGYSYFTNTPVTDELLARLPATIELSVLAIILAAFIGIFLGVLSAVKKNSIIDNLTMTSALIGVSMPVFWLGLLLILFFVPGIVLESGSPWPSGESGRFLASAIAFIINYACYFSEIFRGGIQGVPVGQQEAGQVLGMTKSQIFFHVTLLQMVKRIMPPLSNEIITLVKDTSLARIISLQEVIWAGYAFIKSSHGYSGLVWPLFFTGVYYLVFNGALTLLFGWIEKKLSYFR